MHLPSSCARRSRQCRIEQSAWHESTAAERSAWRKGSVGCAPAATTGLQMLTRRPRLAGIQVVEVLGGYPSAIGKFAFEVPDACAAACEIARRGTARLAKAKDVSPVYEEGCVSRPWKNGKLPAELKSWQDVHRSIEAANWLPPPASRSAQGRGVPMPRRSRHTDIRASALLRRRGSGLWSQPTLS
jgi:hypothetical protein